MTDQSKSFCRSFQQPDETRTFKDHGYLELVNFPDGTGIGRATFEPGWKWSNDVKPIAGTSSCQSDHHGYCVSGRMRVHMDDGQEFVVQAGDVISIPPGHDAWVEGYEACVMIDVSGYQNYAKEKQKAA